jgi:hypothetical protein
MVIVTSQPTNGYMAVILGRLSALQLSIPVLINILHLKVIKRN